MDGTGCSAASGNAAEQQWQCTLCHCVWSGQSSIGNSWNGRTSQPRFNVDHTNSSCWRANSCFVETLCSAAPAYHRFCRLCLYGGTAERQLECYSGLARSIAHRRKQGLPKDHGNNQSTTALRLSTKGRISKHQRGGCHCPAES